MPRFKTISGPPNLFISGSFINSFLAWDARLLVTVSSRQCLDMTVVKIENGSERRFVKHRLNCLVITTQIFSIFRTGCTFLLEDLIGLTCFLLCVNKVSTFWCLFNDSHLEASSS